MSPVAGAGLLAGLLPASRAKNAILRLLGHDVANSASIAPVLLLSGARLTVGADARIGPLNAFRGLRVELGRAAEVGQLNWFSAAGFLVQASTSPYAGVFRLGEHGSFTNRHYVDASGGVLVGAFTTVAGVRSTFMTHGIDVRDAVLDTSPIIIGEHAMVGSDCKLVYGAEVPARSVIAMGSTVVRGLAEEDTLYAGSPARPKKCVEGDYFSRRIGKIPVRGFDERRSARQFSTR